MGWDIEKICRVTFVTSMPKKNLRNEMCIKYQSLMLESACVERNDVVCLMTPNLAGSYKKVRDAR